MKIVFICGSIEPGKDGVGDYTRRLAGEIIRKGNHESIIAMNDRHVSVIQQTSQIDNDIEINILRIPAIFNNSSKTKVSKEFIHRHNPEWLSLQYVPFSFHPKGLHFGLAGMLSKIGKGRKWHIMFHEIWVGINIESSFKIKIWGILQKYISIKSIKKLKPLICETNTEFYQYCLKKIGFYSSFSSIPSNINSRKIIKQSTNVNNSKVVFLLFGGIHFGAPVADFLDYITSAHNITKGKKIEFIFLGSSGIYLSEWTFALGIKKIEYKVYGFCSEGEISNLLSACDFGVSTTPYILSCKSGSLATYLQFEIPVLCVARNWNVKGFNRRELNPTYNISEFDTKKKKLVDYNENPRSNNYSGFKVSANSLHDSLKNFK